MVVSLEGKVAIITGAASGIGFAATGLFLEAGAAGVVAVDLSPDLDANLADMKQQWGTQLTTVTGSVAEDGTWDAAVGAAMGGFGRVDVVVSIAGLGIFKPVHEHTEAEWDNVLGANVKALYHASRHAIPVMKDQQSGLFLNTGSISSVVGMSAQVCTHCAYSSPCIPTPRSGQLHQLLFRSCHKANAD
jgi:NAD(P)-dependent dehydrogenase (short-subunit alcohol dehydrogenase family)